MNQLFCGMHAIIGMANVCKDALKEFENVAASELVTSGYQKGNARGFDILMEISKAFTTGHEYQKGGVVDFWESYLSSKGLRNHIVSFRGERINVLYVIAGAAYYHRNHIKDFLENNCIQTGKLLQAIRDIGQKIFPACFRALGIVGKLITSPLMHLIEDKEKHIFSLNDTWQFVITKLESFSSNATPLMEGIEIILDGKVTKDEIYEELMKENEELDDLTEECLQVLCCSCAILLKRQLKDQLPGGKYYKPNNEIMEETAGTLKENIISEHDFAQLDKLLDKSPTTSTVAASGIVCFINNKIPEYLETLSEEEKHEIIARAIQEVPERKKELQRKKKIIHEKKLEQMKEKREKREKQAATREKRKEELDIVVGKYGGLWCSEDDLQRNIDGLEDRSKKDAIIAQIKYRKQVLSTRVNDKRLLQLTANRKEYSLQELEGNLRVILRGINNESVAVNHSSKYRENEERKELIDKHVERKRKASSFTAAQKEKERRRDKPDLVGKHIFHKWVKEDGEQWICGNVLKAVGNLNDEKCEFEVKYEDEEEPLLVKLYEDFKNGDLSII